MLFSRKSRKPLYFTIIIAVIILLHYAGALGFAESALARALNPVLGRAQAAGGYLRSLYLRQTSREDLSAKIAELRDENRRLVGENAGLKIAETENRILREQLKFFSDSRLGYLTANVVSRGSLFLSAGQETLTIDRGLDDGIAEGMAVVSGEGMVVGKVSSVQGKSSLVTLITSDSCRLAAMVLSSERTSGIAEGELGLSVKMNFIPQSIALAPMDLVVTSGLEEAIPRGLVVGRVSAVEKESNELWQSAVIAPLVDLEELLIVSVVLPDADNR